MGNWIEEGVVTDVKTHKVNREVSWKTEQLAGSVFINGSAAWRKWIGAKGEVS